jgi:paraquat-inducible protein B
LSDLETTPSPAATPEYRTAQRWNVVWVVPLLALLIGAWMIYRSVTDQGPVSDVRFETAEGIVAKKTEVRCRSVKVGIVKEVKLDENLNSVVVSMELDPDYEAMLREGTRFWVVKFRFSGAQLSGVGTVLEGAYIELDPGPKDGPRVNHFQGLETPPATSSDIPGLRLGLTAEDAGSLAVGSPLYYRGFEVGRIESRELDPEGKQVTFNAFVRKEYSHLVKENSRFWNISGIDISAGADGFKFRSSSLQALVSGGATFGIPEGAVAGDVVKSGNVFKLFPNQDEANQASFAPTMKLVLMFDQSIRGLVKKTPVEYRGIQIGRVADISFNYSKTPDEKTIPVLVEIDPSLLRRDDGKNDKSDIDCLKDAVNRGLRASLKTGSLLTGAKFVDLDYQKEYISRAEFVQIGDYYSIPTVFSGFDQLEAKISSILDKVGALDVDTTMKKIDKVADEFSTTAASSRLTLDEINQTLISARKTLDSQELAKLPADLKKTLAAFEKSVDSIGPNGAIQGDLLRTMDELRGALRAFNALSTNLDDKPNSLLFGRDTSGNPIPKAPKN